MKRALPFLLSFFATAALALEGKWTPQQVLQLDPQWLKSQGLELPPSRLWDPAEGTGLLAGAITVGAGCSGGFISADGLFITNHHCLFSILQEHATPQNDIITNGFVAATREAELRSPSMRVAIPRRFTDVTARVIAAVPANAADADRAHAIETASNAMVAECETKPGARCKVATFDGGVQYTLIETEELSDIRLVYAPPRSVGEYGGEIDNWMWPRHTGDFAIGRAYVDGKPYHPRFYFPIAKSGVKPGDFVMVLGYPGLTYRSLTADEMTERRDLWFTRRADLYGEWIRLMEETTKGNAEATIAVADDVKTLANRFKNAEGQLAGFKRGAIVEKQRKADDEVLRWANVFPFASSNEMQLHEVAGGALQYKNAIAAYRGLAANVAEQTKTWERDFLLQQIQATQASPSPVGPKSLAMAAQLAHAAIERGKADAQRDPLYMQRNLPRVRERLEREQKRLYAPADKRVTESFVRRALALPAGQRIAAIDRLFGNGADVAARIDQLYAQSKLFDVSERLKMLDESEATLRARRDPLVDLGFELDRDIRDYASRRQRWDGVIARLRPEWRRAVIAHAGKPVAPDANSTLRVSFAHVMGYVPRDGVTYTPQTTLAGVLEKDTGEEPFNAPKALLDAASKIDPTEVPVDFLADADTTGGNSGSPTVNGRGELVGVNFDRVWENVANDFGYNQAVNRNVNVDIRYLVWILQNVQQGEGLLRELGR